MRESLNCRRMDPGQATRGNARRWGASYGSRRRRSGLHPWPPAQSWPPQPSTRLPRNIRLRTRGNPPQPRLAARRVLPDVHLHPRLRPPLHPLRGPRSLPRRSRPRQGRPRPHRPSRRMGALQLLPLARRLPHGHGHPPPRQPRVDRSSTASAACTATASCTKTTSPAACSPPCARRNRRHPDGHQHDAAPGLFVPFFGVAACTASGLARVALKTGAAVLPGFLLWEESEQQYVLHFYPELALASTGDAEPTPPRTPPASPPSSKTAIRQYPASGSGCTAAGRPAPPASRRSIARMNSWVPYVSILRRGNEKSPTLGIDSETWENAEQEE